MKNLIQKKQLYITLAFICCTTMLWAQDIITLKNGNEIQAKVLEVGTYDIKYKKFENQEGPTYTAQKSEIFMIKYQNGEKDMFSSATPTESASKTVTPNANPITKTGDGVWKPLHFYDKNGRTLSRNEVRKFLATHPMLLKTFNQGCRKIDAGNTFGGIGVAFMVGGLGLLITAAIQDNPEMKVASLVPTGFGLLLIIPAITLPPKGSQKVHEAINRYNYTTASTLNFGVTNAGGIGLVLKF